MDTHSPALSIDALKVINSIMQQKLAALTAHQKASNALATFERDVACDHSVVMNPRKEAKARKHLRKSVKLADQAYGEVASLVGLVGGLS